MGFIPWRNKPSVMGGDVLTSLRTLRAEMERLVDAYVREPFGSLEWPLVGQRNWLPTVDIAENDTEITIRAEVAGVRPEDLEVTVSGNYLVVAGVKKGPGEESAKEYYQSESRFGSFRRTIPLPQSIDPENVDAEMDHGVLLVRLKKSPASQAKRVSVKVKQ